MTVEPSVAKRLAASTSREVARRLRRAMRSAGVGSAEVALSFVSDRAILRLNREFADEDHATDVLSFSQIEGEGRGPIPRDG